MVIKAGPAHTADDRSTEAGYAADHAPAGCNAIRSD
jgi:hypothetical protein